MDVDDMLLLSVIVPVYNVEKYLRRSLGSVLRQIDDAVEVICVDDGSCDGSGELLDELMAGESRLRVVHKGNGGVSSARNRGLDVARGRYIAWLDPDDEVAPDWYISIKEVLMDVSPDVLFFDLCRIEKGKREPKVYGGLARFVDKKQYLAELALGKCVQSYLVIRVFSRHLFDRVRFPENVSLMEDYSALHQLVYQADGVYYLPKILYYYFIRSDSITQKIDFGNLYQATRIARERYHWLQGKGISVSKEGYLKFCLIFLAAVLKASGNRKWREEVADCRREIRDNMCLILSFDIPMKEKVKYMLVFLRWDFIFYVWDKIKRGGAERQTDNIIGRRSGLAWSFSFREAPVC